MSPTLAGQEVRMLEVVKDEEIAAPIGIVFESILEQIGPWNERPDGTPMPMRLEAWPGGRWYRDLGDNAGHLWGYVQAIKPPELLEIQGPLFMSAPVISHVLYRLREERGVTRIQFSHRASGPVPEPYLNDGRIDAGWTSILHNIRDRAMRAAAEKK